MTDPIADMLTRIRNANTAKHDTVDIPSSKMKLSIAKILLDEGYIKSYELVENGNFNDIRVTLKYGADKNEKIISGLREFLSQVLEFMLARMNFQEFSVVLVLQLSQQTKVL